MGTAILDGILKSKSPESIFISDASKEALEKIRKTKNVNISSNEDISNNCDVVIIAVKV